MYDWGELDQNWHRRWVLTRNAPRDERGEILQFFKRITEDLRRLNQPQNRPLSLPEESAKATVLPQNSMDIH